jgi:hypothetical protein
LWVNFIAFQVSRKKSLLEIFRQCSFGEDRMAGVLEIIYKDKNIFCLDLSGLQLKDKAEFREHVAAAKQKISGCAPKSQLVITNITNTGFDTETSAVVGDYAIHNTPFVKASAIVGSSGMQKVIITTIKAVTGRDFFLADSMEEAQEWLIQQ